MFSHLKRRIGVLAAVAVLAALVPTLAVSTASAAPLTVAAAPGDEHLEVACPTGSAAAAGFTDTTSTDVDCIAMFGITLGVTATTYEPSANIPRWQMALYLTRTASIAGHTLGSGADQGFTDISGYSAEIQTAINQLKQLTVTTGTTATTYSPDDNVTREQMAMFINRLLALTLPGPGGNSDGTSVNIVGNAGDAYNYTDIDGGSVTFEGHTAAVALYNLGVPGHDKTVTTFSPATNITRGEMATWLNNALDHTNARPANLSLQFQIRAAGNWGNNSPVASVSYRDSAFAPVAGQVVDMFSWANSTTAGNTNFSTDGTCYGNTNVNIVGSSLTKCTIDVGDPSTDAYGNIAVGALTSSVGAAGTTTYHAWTAAAATQYDNDLHAGLSDTSTVDQSDTVVPVRITVSCDVSAYAGVSASTNGLAHAANVHHGSTVTITAQMTTATTAGVATAVAYPLNRLTVLHKIYQPNDDQNVASATTSAIYTDATGAASYSFTSTDPNLVSATPAATDDVIHSVLITDYLGAITEQVAPAATGTKPCHSGTPASVPMVFDFQDTITDLAMTATQVSNVSSYKAGSAIAPVSRTSTVTMRDKFGDAVTGGVVVFHGGDELALKNTAATGGSALEINSWAPTYTAVTGAPYAIDTAVCFTAVDGGIEGEITAGTTYYLKSITAANPSVITLSTTSTAGANALLVVSGTPSIAGSAIAKAHPTFGCAARTVSPAGTASVAWNDVTTTAGADAVHATTYQTQAITTDNAQSAAARATTSKTAYRWLAPSTTTLATAASSALWKEVDTATTGVGGATADGLANNAADIIGTPLEVDYDNNSMVVGLNYGLNGTHTALVATAPAGDILEANLAVASFVALMPINSAVCYSDTTTGGGALGVVAPGVVYFLKTAADGDNSVTDFTLSATRAATGIAGAALTPTGTPAITADIGPAYSSTMCSQTTYTSYSWDDNDHFYLNSSGGSSSTPTTMAGFEGTYAAGVATYGLKGASADASGLSYAAGTLDAITYQAIAGNTSIWNLGG